MYPTKSRVLASNTVYKAPFHVGTVKITYCESYCDVGSQISNSSINKHAGPAEEQTVRVPSFHPQEQSSPLQGQREF